MKQAPKIVVQAPVGARCRYLTQAYDDILSDSEKLREKLGYLRGHRANAVIDHWFDLISAGNKPALTLALMQDHYDPAYLKSQRVNGADTVAELDLGQMREADLNRVAQQTWDLLQKSMDSAV